MARTSGRSRRERGRPLPPGFGAIWTTVAVDLIGFGIVFPILPRYAEDLDASPTLIGIVVGSFSLAQLVFSPILGRLSDRFGRKPVIIVSLCGTAIGSVLTGLAGSVWVLLAGRLIDGASGASVSVAQAAVADVAPPDQRPRLFGLLGAAFGVGFVLGPAIASFAALDGPRLPFFIAAAIAAANAVVALKRLPETHPRLATPLDATPSTGTGLPIRSPGDRSVDQFEGKGAQRPGAEQEPADRLVPGLEPSARSLRLGGLPPAAVRLVLVAFVGLVAFAGFEATFSLLVEERFGLTLSSTAAVFTAIGVALVLVQGGAIHPVSVRFGELGTLRLGLVANAAGLVLLAFDGGWALLVAALALLVVGQGLVTPTVSSALAARVPADGRGQALGVQQSAGSLARVVGPLAAGVLFEHVGTGAPYAVGAVLVVLAVGLMSSGLGE